MSELDDGLRFHHEPSPEPLLITGGSLEFGRDLPSLYEAGEDVKVGTTSAFETDKLVIVHTPDTAYGLTLDEALTHANALEAALNGTSWGSPDHPLAKFAANLIIALRHCADKLEKRVNGDGS